MRDLRGELLQQQASEEQLPTWQPQPGGVLCGWVRAVRLVQTKHGMQKLAVIEDEESGAQVAVWLSAVVLKNEWERERPWIGARVGICYDGVPAGKRYHKFRLIVDRGDDEAPAAPARPYAAATMSPPRSTRLPLAPITGRAPTERDGYDPFDE